jgi:hypothetical protein
MSGKNIVRPVLPFPPQQYDEAYMIQLVRILEELIAKTELPLTNIPEIAEAAQLSSLQIGDVYKDASGFVKIKT